MTNFHLVQNIKTADWSEEVAPFWGAVIKSAISADGIRGLFKAGWTTIKVISLSNVVIHVQNNNLTAKRCLTFVLNADY